MVICFNCDSHTKQLLDRLLASGQCEDYGELIRLAISNLSVLQAEVATDGHVLIEGQTELGANATSAPAARAGAKAMSSERRAKQSGVPSLFSVKGIGTPPGHITVVAPETGQCDLIGLDRWVFGQYARLLPAKATCRALAHIVGDASDAVPLEEAASSIAAAAANLGDYLRELDEQLDLKRDEALSTGFPATGRKGEKGRLRYATQFVGSVDSRGHLSGLVGDLRLVACLRRDPPYIALTDIGWGFAALENPVLDNRRENPSQKFTAEETSLLLTHIATSVPSERCAYAVILRAVADGFAEPTALDERILEMAPPAPGRPVPVSAGLLATQRSGAISRMADLGLVERLHAGVRVSYVVTDAGREFQETIA
jgi:hypothetical protein